MGIGKSSSQQQPASTQTVRTENTIPEYFKPFLERTLQRGEDISNLPYQQYEGDRIAGFQPLQQQALDLTQQQVGNYQSNLNQANTMAGRAGQALTDIDMSAYMNPYQQNVIDIAKREATRQNDIAGLGRDYNAQQAGAFGGSRHGVLDAEANRTLQQQLSDIQMQGSQQAYDRGVSAFQADRTAAGQTGQLQSALAQATQALGKGDVSALSAMGGQQQAQQQSVLDQAAADFYAQRDAPKSELEWYSGILRGYQPQANVNEQRQTAAAAPSVLGQLGSLGAAGLGMTNFSKGFNAAEGGPVPAPEEFEEGGGVEDPEMGAFITTMGELGPLPAPRQFPSFISKPGSRAWLSAKERDTGKRAAEPIEGRMLPQLEGPEVTPSASVLPPSPATKAVAPPKAVSKKPPLSQPKSVLPGRADSRIPDPTDMGVTSALPRSETAPEVKAADVKKAKEAGWSDEDIGLALMAAGFAGLSSGSPTALGALGAAGQAGVSQLGEIKKGKREQRKLDLEEKLGERKLAAEERGLDIAGRKADTEEMHYRNWAEVKREENRVNELYRQGLLEGKEADQQLKKLQIQGQLANMQAQAEARKDANEAKVLGREQAALNTIINRFTVDKVVADPMNPDNKTTVKVTDMDGVTEAFLRVYPNSVLADALRASKPPAPPKVDGSIQVGGAVVRPNKQ